ncbi:hypothetical protein [uncultured Fluviicola sp.]|uniref:hypothetical protein n=1 Tax=uncultured Fluviicola sp. TaxID=463303 RepID=UPI0025E59188|nr:hypothetical protein [uncultured Fluviicola sp.]
MKTLITTLLFIPFIGLAQYDSSPQFGAFLNPGIRDFTLGSGEIKTKFGLEAGLNVKHSTRNGVLRLVYAVGHSYDVFKRKARTIEKGYSIIDNRIKGVNVLFRPEFRIVNRERVSMYVGVGPRFSAFYSFMEKRAITENGITTIEGWKKKGIYEVAFFGAHAAISIEYKFAEHWVLNLGLNAFTGFEFEFFNGEIYSGGNLTTGVAYVF